MEGQRVEKELTQRELSKLQPPPQVGGAHECLQAWYAWAFLLEKVWASLSANQIRVKGRGSLGMGRQIISKESNVRWGLQRPLASTAGRQGGVRCAAGAVPEVKANTQNADFLSWHFPPVRGFFLFKTGELLLSVVNQFEWAISSLLPPTILGIWLTFFCCCCLKLKSV